MIFLKDVFNPVLKSKSTLWAHPLTKTDTGGSKPTLWPTTFCAQKHHFRKKKTEFPTPRRSPSPTLLLLIYAFSLSHPPQAPTPFSLQNGSLKAFDLWSLKNYASFDIQLVRPFSQPSNLAISYCTLSRNSTLSPHPRIGFRAQLQLSNPTDLFSYNSSPLHITRSDIYISSRGVQIYAFRFACVALEDWQSRISRDLFLSDILSSFWTSMRSVPLVSSSNSTPKLVCVYSFRS